MYKKIYPVIINTKLFKYLLLLPLIVFSLAAKKYESNLGFIPEFSGKYFVLHPKKIYVDNFNELVVKDIDTVWDVTKFSYPRVPIPIGQVEDSTLFGKKNELRSIHLPIKFPKSNIRIPEEYSNLAPVLQQIIDFEYSVNKNFDDYYAYFTFDQRLVPKSYSQRVPGAHVDGIPRDRNNPKTSIDHAYIVSDSLPTMFFYQPFDMTKFDLTKHNFFAIFRALQDLSQTIFTKPLQINLMNAYSIHTGIFAEKDTFRTFIRLEFSKLEFDRIGNSINPSFVNDKNIPNYPFKYIKRDIPKDLFIPGNVFEQNPLTNKIYVEENLSEFGKESLIKILKKEKLSNNELNRLINKDDTNGIVFLKDREVIGFILFTETSDKFNFQFFEVMPNSPSTLPIYVASVFKKYAGNKAVEWEESQINWDKQSQFAKVAQYASLDFATNWDYNLKYKPSDDLFLRIERDTKKHKNSLESIGLYERAKGINVINIENQRLSNDNVDLRKFNTTSALPNEAISFDINKKNTVITTDPKLLYNDQNEIKKILDIRLYPSLRELIKNHRLEIFLGNEVEMDSYYRKKETKLLIKFLIPSSAIYYLAKEKNGKLFVIMSGLSSRENVIAQLITLKLAGIKLSSTKIKIIGSFDNFKNIIKEDLRKAQETIPGISSEYDKVLIIAGCGLENKANKTIRDFLKENVGVSQSISNDIVSLTYLPLKEKVGKIDGIISLNLNYGEITESIVEEIINRFRVRYIFSGSAGGFIPNNIPKPEIGNYIAISKSKHFLGDIQELMPLTQLNREEKNVDERIHLQVPSIFVETYDWLNSMRDIGSSVDVETHYIIKAINKHNAAHPKDLVYSYTGYFVSDYVGEKPLREYSKVFSSYEKVLHDFLRKAFKNT